MANIDQPDFVRMSSSDVPQKLTAADFEIYAPRALAIADMHGEGIATRAEIQHMVAVPAPGEDSKTKEAMQFLLDHYDLLNKMSHSVDVVYGKEHDISLISGIATDDDKNLFQTKYGITPDAIEKMNDVLEGKRAPGRQQINESDGPVSVPVTAGSLVSAPFVGVAAAQALVAGGTVAGMALAGAATLGVGLAVGAAVGFGIYEYEQMDDRKAWRNGTRDQYSAFLQDIEGSEKIRQKLLDQKS